ncbi:MAG: hypothetical protein WCS65_09490 [Verrucomicrobiae bacterium]
MKTPNQLKTEPLKTEPLAPSGPNMAREYRKELRALETQIGRAYRDNTRHEAATIRKVSKVENAAVREIRAIKSTANKLAKGTKKQIDAFLARQAILLGRLS